MLSFRFASLRFGFVYTKRLNRFWEDSVFLPFTSGKRRTAGTRDNEFSTLREWAHVAR